MKWATSRVHYALFGALAGVVSVAFQHYSRTGMLPSNAARWIGVALGGALAGLALAMIIKRRG